MLTHLSEIQKISDEPPDLVLLDDKNWVQIQVVRCNDLPKHFITLTLIDIRVAHNI